MRVCSRSALEDELKDTCAEAVVLMEALLDDLRRVNYGNNFRLSEECTVACERVNMVVTATHNMKDTREERMARYKEERRRALAAQFGPREPVAAVSPRSTRASRLRTLANTDNHCVKSTPAKEEDENSIGDSCTKKEKDKSAKRKSYLNRSHTSEPIPPTTGDSGARRRSGLISTNVTGICLSAPKKPTTNLNSSPIPKSSQLVRNQIISNQKNERGSTPDSDASSSSSRFGKKSVTTPSPVNLSPSHKNVRNRTNSGAVVRSNSGSPAKAPHSILKKTSIEEQTSPLHSVTLPVSILKRKTSQDETVARCASPVRFSPSVVEKKGRGILKKHRSLDEPQVETHSLQEGIEEEKRNGRNGDRRRCSLEEVSRRSPEPQGILKRKASREESESNPDPPQSILKRRSSPLVSTESLSPEPILKKKDEPPVEPRPILKKKSSSEEEEHAVRPILKDSPARRPAAEIRPILKQTEESQIPAVLLRPRARRSYPSENRLSLDAGLLRRLDEPRVGRPLSVAERVQSMETAFNSLDGTGSVKPPSPTSKMDEEESSRGLERSGSVSERASIFAQLEQKEKQAAEAAKARRISKGLRNRSKTDRFSTQPVTVIEVEQAKRNNDPNCDEPSKLTLAERVALFTQREESQKKAPAPPPPRRISQAPLLVEGLMKNLAEKTGVRAPLIVRRLSTSSTSSESENGQDDRLSPNREIDKEMGEVRTLRRCATQPISARDETDDNKPLTIAERLAALKKNGHSNWMKRISRTSPEEELLSTKPPLSGSSRFSEKLGQLEVAAEGWKARVTAPDSHQFSVAGKMGPVSTPQPALGGANRTPAPQVFTQSPASMSTPSVPDSLAALMKRSISVPEGKENEPAGDAPVVQVPEPYDEDFSSFFLSPDLERLASSGDVDSVDLEHISSSTSHLSVVKRNVRITRKHRSTNPLKALAQRSDLRTEYVEVKSGVADREIRRMNIEKLSKNSNMAVEALAGLASKEDIGGVFLKKADAPSALTAQWTHPLLLRVKGRRHPITSVVKPVYTSVNQGDSFILVTKDQVFHWIGEYCSLTEKSRGSDIAQDIAQRKDLGCTGASNVITLESNANSERHKEFWRLLALPDLLMSSYKGEVAGHPEEDSVYEVAMSETYMVYRLSGEKLVPVEQYWGRIPKVAILNPSQVLVFDFRSEVYIWSGKNADMAEKRIGTRLAHELFKGGYNSCWYPTGINWLDEEMSKKERPEWSILRRITQHMEPVIFREKFLDWPDFSKIIQAKQIKPDNDSKADGSLEIRPCDIKEMIDWEPPEPDLILEGTHLGRGKSYHDEETRRLFEVKTLTVDIWHIHDYSRTPLDKPSYGHFHRGDSYIIRWNYVVTVTGRELSGEPSKHGSTGRERIAYLTWHGSDSPSLEQGAAALHTVDLDSEAATQLVVSCGREPPVFLTLVSSPIVVHLNSRASLSKDSRKKKRCSKNVALIKELFDQRGRVFDNSNRNMKNVLPVISVPQEQDIASTRLYIVTGEDEDETRLDEVEVSEKSLRSSATLWLVRPVLGTSYLWYGCCCTFKSQAAKAVKMVASSPPPELGVSVSSVKVNEIEEGDEPEHFLGGSDNIRRSSYHSQLTTEQQTLTSNRQARLYHLTSLTGELTATGVPSLRTRSNKMVTAFPYLQGDLYSASQPAVFILESSSRVWVWTGWSPTDADERGSHMVRHQAEKKAAHTVALGFARAVNLNPADVVTVVAGLEPPAFTSLFPTWSVNEEARAASLEDGWCDGEMRNTQEELAALMRESYPLQTLTSNPLPAGVDPTRLELYLDSTDFKEVFGMEKEEFLELPAWKQVKLKKAVNLF
nr:supervillin-like isoform X2 [Halyomorpha halys]